MGEFSAAWLALREPADHAARPPRLTGLIAAALGDRASIGVVDLGAGTGSNLRYLAPRLAQPQQWLLVDRDPRLLAQARGSAATQIAVETRAIDLADIAAVSHDDLFAGRALVTASALLDLVSAAWLDRVAHVCFEAGAAALFALSYDGRIECSPADEHDELVRGLVNAHQRRDKGFGAALGPGATEHAARAFAAVGYRVDRARSDWTLAPEADALQRELICGWAAAAIEQSPPRAPEITEWAARRLAHVDSGRSRLLVGHEDLAALAV